MVGQTGDAVAQHPTGSMTAARSAPGDSLRSRTGPVNWQLRSDQRERHYSLWNTSLGGRLFLCRQRLDRKSTRLNSSHVAISYAVFCLKKKTINQTINYL